MPNINASTQTTSIQLKEGTAPSTPASGFLRLFADAGGNLEIKDDSGAVRQLLDDKTTLLIEQSSPGTPASGFGRLWVDTSGVLNFTNDGGTTVQLAASSGAKIATGTYTGNGSSSRAITGIGFLPSMVWTARHDAAGGGFRFGSSGTNSGSYTSTFFAGWAISNHINSLDADGFTVGSGDGVNQNTRTYYYVAIG
jgi:hypothetical protein